MWSPSSLSVLISIVADPTVLWNPWQVPFPQQASRSELIPSQAQLTSQLGLFHVRLPQLQFRARNPVVTAGKTVATVGKARCTTLQSRKNCHSRDLLYSAARFVLDEWITSLVSSAAVIYRNSCQADYEKPKITSKQKTVHNITRLG